MSLHEVPTSALLAELARRHPDSPVPREHHHGPLRVAYIGNFEPAHSTENEYRKAWTAAGHDLIPYQENAAGAFDTLAEQADRYDLIAWTRTVWPAMDFDAMGRMLAAAKAHGVPTVGVHLDIWWGLPRSEEIGRHPWFSCDLLATADGGHDREWDVAGIRHAWLPPGVSAFECQPADPDPRFAADVAFVGSWAGYHPQSSHRQQLVKWLERRRCRFWPAPGEHAVRGHDLRRLYASTKVNVGDSCFAGTGLPLYHSDRIPETLGRGGFLLHPYVPGLEALYEDGKHLRYWEAGDWVQLDRLITYYLEHEAERRQIAEQGRVHVLAHHTYGNRVGELVAMLRDQHLLPHGVAA